MLELGTLFILPSQKALWKSGRLRRQWAQSFPQLFDKDDIRLARTQGPRGYHFIEWLAAIVLHSLTGYLALVTKYQYSNHTRKQTVLAKLGILDGLPPRRRSGAPAQAPDLIMYQPAYRDWFFCEVKGPGDKLSSRQEIHFADLSTRFARPVYILRFLEARDPSRFRAPNNSMEPTRPAGC